ncbi:MAG: PUR family DNA/RNA-binding protein [Bacteroidetes bacterium]|nr:PUR family DNA/RNA-binding protein [Bacteroidota bacterium]
MEEMESRENQREEIYSKVVRAGKRTYFFDVKSTKADDYYLTITESKKRFSNEEGKFHYEKHKLFLYKEDFEKFAEGLEEVIEFIKTGKAPISASQETSSSNFSDVSFDDLKEK